MKTAHKRPTQPFTLIEVLVVISIISLLIAVLLPALASARASARMVVCLSSLRQIGILNHVYADSYKDAIIGGSDHSYRRWAIELEAAGLLTKIWSIDPLTTFGCPDYISPLIDQPAWIGGLSYGHNSITINGNSVDGWGSIALKMTEVNQPGKLYLVGDYHNQSNDKIEHIRSGPLHMSDILDYTGRHGKKRQTTNVLFVDSHAQSMSPLTLWDNGSDQYFLNNP